MSSISHIGVARRSGRYPWGSGDEAYQAHDSFIGMVDELKRSGMTEAAVAKSLGMTTTQLRAKKTIALNELKKANEAMAFRLKEKGMSNVAIGERMGIPESSVRNLLNPSIKQKTDVLATVSNVLKDEVASKKYLDVSKGMELDLGVSREKLNTAVALLKEQGYTVHYVKVEQLGNPGKYTSTKVLAPPDTPYSDVFKARNEVRGFSNYSDDGGYNFYGIEPPKSISSKRLTIKYDEDGGSKMDGVIELRRGVPDISLGQAKYAQVRIAVDDSHFLKGMAMYADDLPDGVDIRFNTNKSNTGNKLDALKALKDDPDNPFGAIVRQKHYTDANGKKQLSSLNIVNEEGDWGKWSKSLSSQMASKQSPAFAKEQLRLVTEKRQREFDEINKLTNPAVKKLLLESFADSCDSAAVHLKAAGLPRQKTQVILPFPSIKDSEVYAPNFRDGERVVLIRFPHGGLFEIPELTVNNRLRKPKSVIGGAEDAIGINPKVAERLSGADFDGDTVLVIPNNEGRIKTASPLLKLKDFDPKLAYPKYEGMKPMSATTKQQQMGDVSNLITDMTIKGASHDELAHAVRHSMVVIDAEKHELNYKQSAIDNGIKHLKEKYQGGSDKGASTIISRSKSDIRVPDRKPRPASMGGHIDAKTGQLEYIPTNESYVDKNGKTVVRKIKSTKMAEVSNAMDLVSKEQRPIELVYANHANRLKTLANNARKELISTPAIKRSPTAAKAYSNEVATLRAKLNIAKKNAPLEREAQRVANKIVSLKRAANPDMEAADLKKIKGQALFAARSRVGAKKTVIDITSNEWAAIQAGAVSNNLLTEVLRNADPDKVKELATPRTTHTMSTSALSRAKQMLANGHTKAEVADALGVSTSTLTTSLG